MGFIINGDFLEKYTKEEGVTRAVIPEGVKDIRYHAFDDRDELTSIHIATSAVTVLYITRWKPKEPPQQGHDRADTLSERYRYETIRDTRYGDRYTG